MDMNNFMYQSHNSSYHHEMVMPVVFEHLTRDHYFDPKEESNR